MKKLGLLIFALAILGSFAGVWAITGNAVAVPSFTFFKRVKGSGNIVTEKRDIKNFTGVAAGAAMTIEIVVGEEFSVELTGDDNILPLIKTEVRNGILRFEQTGRIRKHNRISAKIAMPALDDLDVSGASSATVINVKADDLNIEASGASKIEISGVAHELDVNASGASRINAENVQTENADVRASGASRIEVFATNSLNANASGASRIVYAGEPKSVSKDASGASTISPK